MGGKNTLEQQSARCGPVQEVDEARISAHGFTPRNTMTSSAQPMRIMRIMPGRPRLRQLEGTQKGQSHHHQQRGAEDGQGAMQQPGQAQNRGQKQRSGGNG